MTFQSASTCGRGLCWVLCILALAIAAPTVAQPRVPGQAYETDEILVKLADGYQRSTLDAFNAMRGAAVVDVIEELGVYRLQVPQHRTVAETLSAFAADPMFAYVEPNFVGQGGLEPNDTFYGQQWHLRNTGQSGGTLGADIDAPLGWTLTTGDDSIIVAVLDSGIDTDHPEFSGRLVPGFDFVNDDSDPEDDHSHGTLVSGLLAANADNAFGVAGVDHHVMIMPLKMLNANNFGSTFDLADSLIFASKAGAHVISMSLINFGSGATLEDALQFARDQGSILIACAGNGGIGNADVSGPGVSPLTISIGATDHNDVRASFSGTGTALDLVAPGSGVATVAYNGDNDGFSSFSGCSAATPVAAGIATLLVALDKSLSHDDVYDILTHSADDLVGPAAEDTPGRDDFFGHGRVNLNGAVSMLAEPPSGDLNGRWIRAARQICGATPVCRIRGQLSVRNSGSALVPASNVLVYVSTDQDLDETEDTLLLQIPVAALAAGESLTVRVRVRVRVRVEGDGASGQFLIAVLDASGVVAETNEDNNLVVSAPIP